MSKFHVQPHVYIAGPHVFAPNALEYGEKVVSLLHKHGLVGLYPMDNKIDLSKQDASFQIFRANVQLLCQADVVFANVDSFRGAEPDSGTVWEIAYAVAKGIPVIGYKSRLTTVQDMVHTAGLSVNRDDTVDKNGYHIENFGLPLNLMLAHSITVVEGDVESAMQYYLKHQVTLGA